MDFVKSSLTGVWDGLYGYSSPAMPESPFTAVLFQSGEAVSGTIHETMRLPRGGETQANAFIEGDLNSETLQFVKTYDGESGRSHSVAYEGRLSGDGAEIEGTWKIGAMASGRFLMIRAQRRARARQTRVAERA